MPDALRGSDPVPLPDSAERRCDRLALVGILLCPVAVAINTVVGFTVAHWTIAVDRKTSSYIVAGVDLGLCALAAALAWVAQHQLRTLQDTSQTDRRQFMVKLGLLLSAFSAIVIVASIIALLTMSPSD